MLHDRTSLYETVMRRKNDSFWFKALYLIFEYSTLIGVAFLHYAPGKWLFRTPATYIGTAVVWISLFIWSGWGFWFIEFLNDLLGIFSEGELFPAFYQNSYPLTYHPVPGWFWYFSLAVIGMFLIQHLALSPFSRDKDDLYTGYPWMLHIFRVVSLRKPRTDEREEAFFKRAVEPLFIFGISFIAIDHPFFFWLGMVVSISLFAREQMLKNFYEVNQVNSQDVVIRAEQVAEGAGMSLASKRKGKPVAGHINPALLKTKKTNAAQSTP